MIFAAAMFPAQRMIVRRRHNVLMLPMREETTFERAVLNVIGWFLGY